VLKGLVYSLSNEHLAFLCEQLARAERLIVTLQRGSLFPGAGEALRRLASLTRRPGLAARIIRTARAMTAVRRHYGEYPDSPAALGSWMGRNEMLRRSGRDH
jgi:hypothetical protein